MNNIINQPSSTLKQQPITPVMPRSRKRKRLRLRPPVQATPQTLAKLKPAPWADWPADLQQAAQEINIAFRLIAATGLVQARDWQTPFGSSHFAGFPNLTPAAERLIRRYRRWADRINPSDLSLMIDVVVQGEYPATNSAIECLQQGLESYAGIVK